MPSNLAKIKKFDKTYVNLHSGMGYSVFPVSSRSMNQQYILSKAPLTNKTRLRVNQFMKTL